MKTTFGAREISAVVFIAMVNRLAWVEPQMLLDEPGQSAWMLPLVALPLGLIAFWCIHALCRRYGNAHQCCVSILGRGGGAAVLIAITAWMLCLFSIALARVINVTQAYFFPLTDVTAVAALYVAGIVLCAFAGAAGTVRTCRMIVWIPVVALIVLLLCSMPQMDFTRLKPIWGEGPGVVLRSGVAFASVCIGIYFYWLWNDHTTSERPVARRVVRALVLGSVVLSVALSCMSAAMGKAGDGDAVSLLYNMAANISLGRFIQRLGPIFFFCWCLSSVAMGGAYLCGTGDALGQCLGLTDKRPVYAGLGAVVLGLCIALNRQKGMDAFATVAYLSAAVMVLIPALLWGIDVCKRRLGHAHDR